MVGGVVAERERERGLISIFLSIATVKGLLLLCAFFWVNTNTLIHPLLIKSIINVAEVKIFFFFP